MNFCTIFTFSEYDLYFAFFSPSAEDCDAFGDRSNQRNATSEILGVDAPGSSHWSSHSEELVISKIKNMLAYEDSLRGEALQV
ncbi:unnamed protein product [Arctogadus glacialis]